MAIDINRENAILGKLTYGATTASRAEFRKLGLTKWLADQLNPKKVEAKNVSGTLKQFRALNMDQVEIQRSLPYSINGGRVSEELAHTTLYRRLASSRQLYETLVEFLQDYLPIPLWNDAIKRMSYDRDVIRKYALGTFPELVYQSAMHPEMLQFLSGYANERNHPNENYGRELLELFTVTTATPYTQTDVVNAARVMSGFGWRDDTFETTANIDRHWNGKVQVLDWSDDNLGTSPAAMFATARSLITHLALKPETANAFSLRMAKRYVSDSPSSSLVSAMAAKYLATGGSIPAVVTVMATHADFASSNGQKLKRPAEHLVSTMRALDMNLDGQVAAGNTSNFDDYFKSSQLGPMWWLTQTGGHDPFNWPFPNGFPDTEPAWSNLAGQLTRINNVTEIVSGWNGWEPPDWKVWAGKPKNSNTAILDAVSTKILGYKVTGKTRAAILAGMAATNHNFSSSLYMNWRIVVAAKLIFATEQWNRR